VVEAANHGRLISEINLELDRESGEVLRDRTTSVSHANTRDVAPDPDVLAMAQYWRDQLAERRMQHVAPQTGDLLRASDDREESTLANLTADAYLWASAQDGDEADLAVSLPGTLLRDLPYAPSGAMPGDATGAVTFGEVFFGLVVENGIGWAVVTGDVTGRQIHDLLESQWQQDAAGGETFQALAVSGNVTYRYDASAPVGDRVAFGQVRVNGAPLKPNETYRIATLSNNFAQTGFRPPFLALQGAEDQHRTMFSGADAVAGYLAAHAPVTPPALDRVSAVQD
jgi:5'-nucleotidase